MRKNDETEEKYFFRVTDRVFCLNGEWYFQTREIDRGPYSRREAAEAALDQYVMEMDDLNAMDPSVAVSKDKVFDRASLRLLDDDAH